jgi:ADP-ribose pyrophosphatase YjhB (NUDIX family)
MLTSGPLGRLVVFSERYVRRETNLKVVRVESQFRVYRDESCDSHVISSQFLDRVLGSFHSFLNPIYIAALQ